MADVRPQADGFFGFFPTMAFVLFLVLILLFWGLGDGAGFF